MTDYNRNECKNQFSNAIFSNTALFLSCGCLFFCIGPLISANLLASIATEPVKIIENTAFFLGLCVYIGFLLSTSAIIVSLIAFIREKKQGKKNIAGFILSLFCFLFLLALLLIGSAN